MTMPETVNEKLGDLSYILSDGYKWLKIRTSLEYFEERAQSGDTEAEEIIKIFNQSYRLFKFLGDVE